MLNRFETLKQKVACAVIFIIGVAIFCLRYWTMQKRYFYKDINNPTYAEWEYWISMYDSIDALCWLLAYVAFYAGALFIPYSAGKVMMIFFAIIFWTTVTNLIDEIYFDNTMLHEDEYAFFIILIIYGTYQLYRYRVKRKSFRSAGDTRR